MKEKKQGISLVALILIIVGIILAIIYVPRLFNLDKTKSEQNNTIAQNSQIQNENNNTEANNNEEETFDNMLVEYVLDSIEKYANNGYLFKDTTGDSNAEKITVQELRENRATYKNKIINLLPDKRFFGSQFIINGKDACTYNFEKILNELNIGTHMGIGIGCYDNNGNKLYISGNTDIENAPPTATNVIKYFGYSPNAIINSILDSIELYSEKGYLFKMIDDGSEAERLTLEETQNNRQVFNKKLVELIESESEMFELYFENETLNCKYNYENVINRLGIKSNNGNGIQVNQNGVKTYTFN